MTTLAQAKNSILPVAINIRPEDSRFVKYLNSATERLLHRGKYWGTAGRFNIAINSQLLTLPAQIATIEQISVAHQVLPLRSMWFEFLPGGFGERDETLPNGSGINECLYRGNFPTIVDIETAGTLTIKCDVSSDVGKEVLILGYDNNGNWIRTLTAGIWNDGEPVLLAQGAGTVTTHSFSRISGIQFPDNLDGQTWLYLGDSVTGTLLGNYQYWELNPSYKRYLVPFINTTVSTVVVMGKLAFRLVAKDTDTLVIGNLAALQLGIMAVKAELEHNWVEANLLWNGGTMRDGTKRIGALQELDFELDHHLGSGQQIGISLINTSAGFGEPVETLV